VLNVRECAQLLGVRPGTVRAWIHERKIEHEKIGPPPRSGRDCRPVRIRREVAERFAQTVKAAQ